jgi:hypothetical protein
MTTTLAALRDRQGRRATTKSVRDNLRVKEVFVSDGRRRYVVCHNPQEVERHAPIAR